MKTIYAKLLFVFVLIFMIGCLHYQDAITFIKSNYQAQNNQKDYIVKVKTKSKTLEIPLEEYLVGVVAGEMPVSFEEEALKAQVVASRTFVLSRKMNVDNTTNSQVFLTDSQMKKNWGNQYKENKEKVEKAVKETSYEVMTYQGKYISAMFFSSSNGKTVNCEDYFNGEVAYLKSVDSHWDLTIDPGNIRYKTFTKTQLANAFGVKSPNIEVTSHTESGYVKNVTVNGKTYPYMEGTKLGDYLISAHYADKQLGLLVEELEKEGILDDTVIVIYGDHDARVSTSQWNRFYNYDPETDGVLDSEDPDYQELDYYWQEINRRVPLIIWSNDQEFQDNYSDTISTAMGMYDLAPTLSNMLGVYNKYALGSDIMNKKDNTVAFPNGNFVTNYVYYNDNKEEYKLLKNVSLSEDYINKNKEYTQKIIDVSNDIIVYDYFSNEFSTNYEEES